MGWGGGGLRQTRGVNRTRAVKLDANTHGNMTFMSDPPLVTATSDSVITVVAGTGGGGGV